MTQVTDWLKQGWRVLEGIHTALWLFGLFGVAGSSVLQWALHLWKSDYAGAIVVTQALIWVSVILFAVGYVGYKARRFEATSRVPEGAGGAGGSVSVVGNNAIAIAGRGGDGGVGGVGGKGGGGEVRGDNALVVGGDGGNSGTADGRGGRGARSPMERMGTPTHMWPFGRGGAGANAPEYDRRLALLSRIRNEYRKAFPDEVPFIDAGVDAVPVVWVNKRLEEIGEPWRISGAVTGYSMPRL